ncbi:MAG: N-formylglutamate amidohydrolase, partial [Gimesia chilikensis]
MKDLGLNAEQLQSHIGWDIGAADLARELSSKLDATLVLSNYSRLVIDCNRWPRHPESIPAQSAGITIPGNALVSDLDVMHRRRALFEPYQLAIANVLGQRKQADIRLLSIHSFTPVLNGSDRPWSIGVCFGDDEGWAKQLASDLRAQIDEPVGINQPYSVEAEYE